MAILASENSGPVIPPSQEPLPTSHLAGFDRDALEKIVVAQSQFIDTILTRLVVLDRGFDPVQRGDWSSVKAGRLIAQEAAQALAETPS